MPTYEGCVQAKEISLTRKGANQMAKVLIRKSAAAPAAGNQVETSDMPTQAEISKAALAMTVAIAKMNDVTRTHFLALGDDAQLAFLEKSADDQRVEAETAKALVDRKAIEAEAEKSGRSATEVELKKSNDELRVEIETLKGLRATDEIEKRATTEFANYPGGVKAAVEMLKTAGKADAAGRQAIEDLMKAQCATVATSLLSLGGRSEEELSKSAGAKARVDAKAEEVAKSRNISLSDAFVAVTEMPEFAADAALLV